MFHWKIKITLRLPVQGSQLIFIDIYIQRKSNSKFYFKNNDKIKYAYIFLKSSQCKKITVQILFYLIMFIHMHIKFKSLTLFIDHFRFWHYPMLCAKLKIIFTGINCCIHINKVKKWNKERRVPKRWSLCPIWIIQISRVGLNL